ncbi:MAG: PKD domain-containing protein, partial [Flavobacteriales bacterium]|nr:PKD domain-containing protein [Flavobacteriales bacterium]
DGGKVYIYNDYGNQVLGAYTSAYNTHNTIRATQMVQGNTMTIEYYAPAGTIGFPIIDIKEVVYYYRGVEDFVNGYITEAGISGGYPKASSCEIDVVCTPESTGWAEQIDAAVHYTFSQGASTYVCSASMINNTSLDCTPYIITAWHCGEPNAGSSISSWVWYWNYQKTTCSPGSNGSDPSKGTDTMTGGTVRASSGNGTLNNPPGTNQVAGSDFYLVELSSEPPTSYGAYYEGWNRANTASPSGVCVHHPAGSAKKISTYTSSLSSATYNGGASGGHWAVTWSATTNGHGVTEGGSSGSPIFDVNGRFVGQLSGGSSFCSTPTSSDLYGKFYTDWDLGGTTANAQLKPWLDPTNTGVMTLDGTYQPCAPVTPVAPTCAISANFTTITAGGNVDFTDNSTGIPTSWSWNFGGGGAPATSTTQNPTGIVFGTPGVYTVTFTATNAQGSCNTTIIITVLASTGCDTLSNIADTSTITLYGSTTGYLTGVNNYGDLQKAEKYTGYAPWTHVNGAQVGLFDVRDGGNGSTFDLVIYSDATGLPGTEIDRVSFDWLAIETALGGPASQGVINLLFNTPVNVGSADFYIGVDFSSFGAGDTMGVFQNLVTVGSNTAYEQWSDLTWHDMETAWGAGNTFSLYINPFMTDLPVAAVASATPTTICAGQPISFDGSASTNTTGYNWYFTGGTPATGTNVTETVTYAAAGTYTAYLVADGACSGQAIDSVIVTITSGATVVSTGTDPTCAGGDGTITISATGGSGSYEYSIDGGSTFQPSSSFSSLTANTYNIVVNDLTSGCTSTDSYTLNPTAGSLTITTVETDESCAGGDGTITISVTGGSGSFEYSTNGGSTFQPGNTFSGLTAGSYNVVVNDLSNSCGGSTTSTVGLTGLLSVSGSGVDPSCAGGDGTITVSASGGSGSYEYSIDGGATFFPSGTFTGQNAGTYGLIVNDLTSSCAGNSTVTLNSTSGITSTYSSGDPTCNSSCNGTITVTASGGSGSLSYVLDGGTPQATGNFSSVCSGAHTIVISDGGGCNEIINLALTDPSALTHSATTVGATCGGTNGSIIITAAGGTGSYTYYVNGSPVAGATVTGLTAGSYSITVQDGNGCASAATNETISGTTAVSASSTAADETCNSSNGSISITATGGDGSFTFSIDGGVTFQSSGSFVGIGAGTYNIIVQDGSGCTDTGTEVLTNTGGVTANASASNTSICTGDNVTLTATGGTTYTWSTGQTTSSFVDTPAGTTTYNVTAVDGAGCSDNATITVTVNTNPITTVTADTSICSGETVMLTGNGGADYFWNTTETTQSILASPTSTSTYSVISSNGSCVGTTASVVVTVLPSPTMIATASATTVYITSGATVNFTNTGSPATSYNWNFGDGNSSTSTSPSNTYSLVGTYTVILTGTLGSCTDTDTITITVLMSVAIHEVVDGISMTMYPNPTEGLVNINMVNTNNVNVEIQIMDAIGKIIGSQQHTGHDIRTSFDLSNRPAGIYLVRVLTNGGVLTKRISVTH